MKFLTFAAFALIAATSLAAQTPTPTADFTTATPLSGNWSYAATTDGSEATFSNSSGNPQVWIHCTRATRRVSIAKPASGAAPFINVWTSSLTRSVPASFNPVTGRLSIEVGGSDPLLDAIATSRGRAAFTVGAQPALVVPTWSEPQRVIEDCRG
jgi:hypothetical protein